jgi:phage antirepressor YoqD-like protein
MQGIELKRSAEAVKYHDQVLSSVSTYTVTQIAKEFGWGAKTLNEKLHMWGIQYKLNGQWLLYSQYCDKDYTRTITFTVTDAMGCMHTRQSTEWTEKGRKFIHEQIEKHKNNG